MSFINIQHSFIDAVRDPCHALPDGVSAERMAVYRELFFNNVSGFVGNAFPVLKGLYSTADWDRLMACFFKQHDCQSPLFSDIAEEFLFFLQEEYCPEKQDPPFMLELAHYEWLELVVSRLPDDPHQAYISSDEISASSLCLSAAARVAQYNYAVQQIRLDYQPIKAAASPQFFCVYRDRGNKVCFLTLTPLAAQLLGYVAQFDAVNVEALYQWLIQTFAMMEEDSLIAGCRELLKQLQHKGIIREYIG